MIPSITEEDFCEALRVFLVAIVEPGISVTQGQVNRVAEPAGPTFLVFWPSLRTRMATTVETWGKVDAASAPVTNSASTQFQAQVDLHGPGGSDIAQNVATLLRSQWGVEQFDGTGIVPLYATDGSQAPFVNGEGQYENRWTMTIALGASPSVSTAQDFADSLTIEFSPTGAFFHDRKHSSLRDRSRHPGRYRGRRNGPRAVRLDPLASEPGSDRHHGDVFERGGGGKVFRPGVARGGARGQVFRQLHGHHHFPGRAAIRVLPDRTRRRISARRPGQRPHARAAPLDRRRYHGAGRRRARRVDQYRPFGRQQLFGRGRCDRRGARRSRLL